HVAITHYPLNRFGTSKFESRSAGKHGTFFADTSDMLSTSNSGTNKKSFPPGGDVAATLAGFYSYLKVAIDSNASDSIRYAAQVLPTMVTPEMSPMEISAKMMEIAASIDEK